MDLQIQIEKIINDYHEKTGGKCGLSIVVLANELGKDYSEIRPVLNKIYSEKKITIRQGINNQLIFKRIKTK